ncbi:MAG: hypothetical protein DLM53_05610 [Candidatus Eremiobacter antarcticus]|nr:VIT1/CCC1 transporter family protein [Candidatus Eremiobacteraeota bacterium]MBC5806993.1 VIT1/CCC1 transporter family protein [Candidatus Eremiobacteraeota bacterium]PZR62874.1 MAG: hypothetical protein DLM53_05610 [Candidatus Eremiobacter sp. RRmetagenome_bin22]
MNASVSKTELNLWMAFSDEAKTQRLYAAYALAAMNEGYPEAAEAFMEAAGAEVIHAMSHLQALGAVKSTAENLRHVVEEESRESEHTYPRYIEEARQDGRQDAVRTFTLALNRERHHIELFQRTLAQLASREVADGAVAAAPRISDGDKKPGRSSGDARAQITEGPLASSAEGELSRTARAGAEKMTGPAEISEERARIASRSRIRELVFGAQDGVLTTVGVVSAFFGATAHNSVILLAGLASGFAGMVAMTAGSYLSSKAEADVERSEIIRERQELTDHPAEELAELVEIYRRQGMGREQARNAALQVAKDPKRMLEVMARQELGLELEPQQNAIKDAGVMALSFLSGAVFPIVPYVLINGLPAFVTSILLAAVVLFAIGVIKARAADTSQLRSGVESFGIGAAAGLLGYILGTLIPKAFGVNFIGG